MIDYNDGLSLLSNACFSLGILMDALPSELLSRLLMEENVGREVIMN